MSIFKRRDQGDVEQKRAAPSAETGVQGGSTKPATKVGPPFVPPGVAPRSAPTAGVVPPPAAPIYSTRPPESAARREGDADSPVATTVWVAADAQHRAQDGIQGRLEAGVQRRRVAAAPGTSMTRRPAQRPTPVTPRAARPQTPPPIDPTRFAQTGLLNLAWSWQQAGAPIRAIHAYMQLLGRYPGTPAAAAAVADLVEISDTLAKQGQFHTALAIYDQLEELLAFDPCEAVR